MQGMLGSISGQGRKIPMWQGVTGGGGGGRGRGGTTSLCSKSITVMTSYLQFLEILSSLHGVQKYLFFKAVAILRLICSRIGK